jgi:hypothetical protein
MEGLSTPARLIAVVGFNSGSAAMSSPIRDKIARSSIPVPFGRPRRRTPGVMSERIRAKVGGRGEDK